MDGRTFLVGCVVGGLLGGVAGALLTSDSASVAPRREAIRSGAHDRRLDALTAQVERLVRTLENRAASRAPADHPPSDGADDPSAGHEPIETPPAAATEFRSLARTPTDLRALEPIGRRYAEVLGQKNRWYAIGVQISSDYVLWTLRDLLREFGRPESATHTGPFVVLHYPLPVSGTQNRYHLAFHLRDGLVIYVRVGSTNFQEGR